jgi:glutamate N-acetyltransferase/amino-acid N-acetyltransferase
MSVTAPKGFRAAGVAAGLKPRGARDVALVVNDAVRGRATAAAVFTPNRFAAAPVRLSQDVMARYTGGLFTPRAVILNSGGANACTGEQGREDALETQAQAAQALRLLPEEVLVCSTGLIGERLPMGKLLPGVRAAAAAQWGKGPDAGGRAAAEAIMTTDTVPKEAALVSEGGYYSIGGMAKGAGMLAPELATMLVVLTTDAAVVPVLAQRWLEEACERSFNRIDSDGCMSTNDTVILLCSAWSGVSPDKDEFVRDLTAVCQDLARQLIADAEGAHHEIAVKVTGAFTEDGALKVARAIGRSNLFKTAVAGNDPNWGRILSAAGTVSAADAPCDPARVDVIVNGVEVARQGGPGEPRSKVDLKGRHVEVTVDLHVGRAEATILTNDLTHEYVSINADYSS